MCLTFLKVELLSSKSVTCIKFEWAVRHVVDIFIQSLFLTSNVVFSAIEI